MRMDRRRCLVLFAAAILFADPVAGAESRKASVRLGIIEFSSAELRRSSEQALRAALRAHGYVEGENLVLERRYAEGRPERVGEIANELAAIRLDAVVSTCTPTT